MLDRIEQKIAFEPNSGCWLWMGSTDGADGAGYPLAFLQRVVRLHRMVAEIPDGLDSHHLCGVKCCVNPDHIVPIDHSEHGKLHSPRQEFCKRGHDLSRTRYFRKNGQSKGCRECHRLVQRRLDSIRRGTRR